MIVNLAIAFMVGFLAGCALGMYWVFLTKKMHKSDLATLLKYEGIGAPRAADVQTVRDDTLIDNCGSLVEEQAMADSSEDRVRT